MIALSPSNQSQSLPALRQHVGGHWFVRIPKALGGGSKWFGADEQTARTRLAAFLKGRTPSTPKPSKPLGKRCATDRLPTIGQEMPTVGTHPMTIKAAADSLFAVVDSESGEHGRKKVRACTARFVKKYGDKFAHDLTPGDLIAFKASLSKLTASSKNDQLVYSRRLLGHCWDVEAVQEPFRLKVLANVKRGTLPDKAMKPDAVRQLIEAIHSEHPVLARLCLLQFYLVARPSEVPKAVWVEQFDGEWESEGVLATAGKSTRKTGEPRRIIFSEPAMILLKAIGSPTWDCGNGEQQRLCPNGFAYGHFARKIGKRIEAKVEKITGKTSLSVWGFRHAANQGLLDAGVSEEDCRKAAGHVRDRVRRAYGVRENYSATRQSISVLADLVPLKIVGL
jgi:integrase